MTWSNVVIGFVSGFASSCLTLAVLYRIGHRHG